MNKLIKYFPRQIAFPERILCENRNVFFETFRTYQGVKSKLYYSLYNCNFENNFEDAKIDKVGLDFDSQDCFENIKKCHKKLLEKNLIHIMIFSTRGFWLYIFTKNYEKIKNTKDCLLNTIEYLLKLLNITMGEPDIADTDFHCKDIARVARLPTSYDIERRLYCIPITSEDLTKGFDFIKQKAKNVCYNFIYYCEGYLDISQFDEKRRINNSVNINIPNFNYNFKDTDKLIKDFIPCIKYHLLKAKEGKSGCNWRFRWLFVVYCRTISLPKGVTDHIAKKYFSNVINKGSLDGRGTNYDHFVKTRMLDYGYSNTHKFPNCETLFSEGICKGKCEKYNKLYK